MAKKKKTQPIVEAIEETTVQPIIEETVEETEVVTDPITQVEETIVDKLRSFIERIKGKPRLTQAEVKEMFSLYTEKTGIIEKDYTCDVCAIRVYKQIKKILDIK